MRQQIGECDDSGLIQRDLSGSQAFRDAPARIDKNQRFAETHDCGGSVPFGVFVGAARTDRHDRELVVVSAFDRGHFARL